MNKQMVKMLMAVLAAAMLAAPQALCSQDQPQQPASPQQPGQPQMPGAQPQQPGMPTPPAAPVRRPPQAQSQEELSAFNAARGAASLEAEEQAADQFAQQYPSSELVPVLYLDLSNKYQAVNNSDKTIAMAKKTLQYDPDNTFALVNVALTLAERTRATDLDKDERLAEAEEMANKAIKSVPAGIPGTVPDDRLPTAQTLMVSMAKAALGAVEMTRENYQKAEEYLSQSVQENDVQPDAITWLRLAIAHDRQQEYQDGLKAAQRALDLAKQTNQMQVVELAQQERDRLSRLVGTQEQQIPSTIEPKSESAPPGK